MSGCDISTSEPLGHATVKLIYDLRPASNFKNYREFRQTLHLLSAGGVCSVFFSKSYLEQAPGGGLGLVVSIGAAAE